MRRSPVAAILVLALAPAAHAAEAKVAVTGGGAGAPVVASATYAEPGSTLLPALTDSTATVTVRQGPATKLTLRVGMPNAARLAPGTYDVAAGATVALTPNGCGTTPLAGTFTLHHAIPGARQMPPTELYLTATVHCGANPAATTVAVRLQRPGSRASGKETPKAFLPVIDGLSTAWSTVSGQAVFAPFGGPRTRFSKKGETYLSQGLDRGRAVLQHLTFAHRRLGSGLELWQLQPKLRLPLTGVNTPSWEWGGALSGDWLLFQRGEFDARSKSVRLVNLKTGARRAVVTARGRATGLEPGDLSGDYATYKRCTTRCRVTRYQLSTRRTVSPRPPKGFSDYAPAVLADGTLFFARARAGCGKSVAIMRLSPGTATPVRVGSVARGHDVQKMDATLFAGTRIAVYERYSCSFRVTTRDDVRVVDAPPVPPAA